MYYICIKDSPELQLKVGDLLYEHFNSIHLVSTPTQTEKQIFESRMNSQYGRKILFSSHITCGNFKYDDFLHRIKLNMFTDPEIFKRLINHLPKDHTHIRTLPKPLPKSWND